MTVATEELTTTNASSANETAGDVNNTSSDTIDSNSSGGATGDDDTVTSSDTTASSVLVSNQKQPSSQGSVIARETSNIQGVSNLSSKAKLVTATKTTKATSNVSESDSNRVLLNRLTLGLVDWLKHHPNVTSLKVSEVVRADKVAISTWEQQHMCTLPDDLKSFYQTMNGFSLSWAVSMATTTPGGIPLSDSNEEGDASTPVGAMNINPVQKLNRVAGIYEPGDYGISLADIDSDDDLYYFQDSKKDLSLSSFSSTRPKNPKFNEKSRIFELDSVDKCGRVCLVYKNTRNEAPAGSNPEIWFLDRSLTWHFLAHNFTTYFRLMIVHLGLPQWLFLFVNIGISQRSRQWFNFFAPTRLALSSSCSENPDHLFGTPMYVAKFDAGRVFKGKSARNKAGALVPKKKPSTGTQSSTPTAGGGGGSGSSGSHGAGKTLAGATSNASRTTSAGAGRRV